jgi:dTDP-L-rhamnose 4-epimerase
MAEFGTVLVTGGAGFIGCALSEGLTGAFSRVVALDNLHPQIHATRRRPAALASGVELVVGDVTDAAAWDTLLPGLAPDVVIHLAAETGTGQSLVESSRHGSVNVVGTTQMMDALNRHGLPRRIVLSSSRAVYGEGAWRRPDGSLFYPPQRTSAMVADAAWDFPGGEPVAMDARVVQPAPVSVYAATKLAQEHLLRVWGNALGAEVAVVRLQNVYGPGQSLSNPYTGILSLFARMARAGKSIPLYEDGEVRRDFVLIDDVASAILAAATSDAVSPVALDIGSGEFQTIGTAASAIAAYYGAPAPHVTGQFREGDVRHAWADVTAAREVLGWTPRYTLADGVQRLCDWIEQQPEVPPA